MVNRIMLRQRFKQWVGSTEYIVSVEDAATLGAKIVHKRRLRNNFHKYLGKVKEQKRLEHVQKKLSWFSSTRAGSMTNDCYQSWREYVRRHKLAKKFLIRSSNGLDRQLLNEGFSIWKQMCSVKRQRLYLDNIEELGRRKADHEGEISNFKIRIE